MDINTVLEQMAELKIKIDDILSVSTYGEHADLRGLHVDRKDSDKFFLLKEICAIMRKLADTGTALNIYPAPSKK